MERPTLTSLDDALAGVATLCFDTTPLIYLVERHPDHVVVMHELARRLDVGTLAGSSSVITLTEVLVRPVRLGLVELTDAYRTIPLQRRNFTLVPSDAAAAQSAADLRARYNLRTPDALQVAAALQFGSDAFLTNDQTFRRVSELRVVLLSDLEL